MEIFGLLVMVLIVAMLALNVDAFKRLNDNVKTVVPPGFTKTEIQAGLWLNVSALVLAVLALMLGLYKMFYPEHAASTLASAKDMYGRLKSQ